MAEEKRWLQVGVDKGTQHVNRLRWVTPPEEVPIHMPGIDGSLVLQIENDTARVRSTNYMGGGHRFRMIGLLEGQEMNIGTQVQGSVEVRGPNGTVFLYNPVDCGETIRQYEQYARDMNLPIEQGM